MIGVLILGFKIKFLKVFVIYQKQAIDANVPL